MMTKAKIRKIMECDAERWQADISSDNMLTFKALDIENGPRFKVIVDNDNDDDTEVSYVIFYDDKVDILFPDTEKNKELLNKFLEFVYELMEDFEEEEVEE